MARVAPESRSNPSVAMRLYLWVGDVEGATVARLTRDKKRKIIQFELNKKKYSVRLGEVTEREAENVLRRIESLVSAKRFGEPIDADTERWLNTIDDKLHDRIVRVHLTGPRAVKTLGSFIDQHIEAKAESVKPATVEVWKLGKCNLVEFFGADAALRDITPGHADRFRAYLQSKNYASDTINKRLQFAANVFKSAMRFRLIGENPFEGLSVKTNRRNRKHFISHADTRKLLSACPDRHWRAIVALSRFGGLRCPSEVLSVRWQDVDWAGQRLLVTSPKTEHHAGKGSRVIPLFPELAEVLSDCFEAAEEGEVYIAGDHHRAKAKGPKTWRNANLRTQFNRIIRRAHMTPWERLFHNLRSSRQTELADQYPVHVVCQWLGNSRTVAQDHYLQVTEEHFARAVQNPVQSESVPSGAARKVEAVPVEITNVIHYTPSGSTDLADLDGLEPSIDWV